MIIKSTISFCPTCYKRIAADIFAECGSVYMRKYCSEHGQTVAMVERDVDFYQKCSVAGRGIYDGYFIDVTDRCNIKCKYCFHGLSSAKDPSIERLVQEAVMARGYGQLIITGGEPSIREDLPQVLEQLSRVNPGNALVTNGVQMDAKMLDACIPHLKYWNGAVDINLSMHPESNGADKKLIGLMRERGLKLGSILWVIDDLSQIPDVVDFAEANKDVVPVVRLKAATKLWSEQKPENKIFVSDMLKYFKDNLYNPEVMWWLNNRVTFFNASISGIHFMLVSWYDVNNIDILDYNSPPVYKSKIGLVENLVTSCIVNEGISKGWVDGVQIKCL